jgi:hypothetical protein
MADIHITTQVDAPPDVVFDVAADLANAADHIDGITKIEMLTDGPIGVGMKFRETRVMFGREHTEEMEVTAFNRPTSYTVEATSCGCHFASTFRFTPKDGGTEMVLDTKSKPLSLFAKIMSPLSGLMMGAMKKAMEQDMFGVKQVAEARAQVGVAI